MCDKTIIESGRWLTDEIINSSQLILAKQFQNKFLNAGFLNSVLGQLLCFAVQQQEFVQVLHDKKHWLTISTVGTPKSTILVYDSLYSSAGEETKSQITSMLIVEEDPWPHVSPIPHTLFFQIFFFYFRIFKVYFEKVIICFILLKNFKNGIF